MPKLLHTPLMALTNALSAIALVGSLVILGQAETTYSIDPRLHRGGGLHDQRGRRLPLTDKMLKMFKQREPAKPRAEAETEASP